MGTTFLLIESDDNDLVLMREQFKSAHKGIQLRNVRNCVEARQYLNGEGRYSEREDYPLPDVILLALETPDVGGFELLEWLQKESPTRYHLIPVIMISSSNDPDQIQRAYMLGANGYMVKPIKWEDFKERIRALGVYWAEHVETPEIGLSKEEPKQS